MEFPLTIVAILFAGWLTNRHYHNKYDIEELRIKLNKSKEIGDLLKMQNDLNSFSQSLVNIDRKYKAKYDDINDRFEQLLKIVMSNMTEDEIFNSFGVDGTDIPNGTITVNTDNTDSHLKVISTVQDALDEISKGKKK